jgi:hypothetical protein
MKKEFWGSRFIMFGCLILLISSVFFFLLDYPIGENIRLIIATIALFSIIFGTSITNKGCPAFVGLTFIVLAIFFFIILIFMAFTLVWGGVCNYDNFISNTFICNSSLFLIPLALSGLSVIIAVIAVFFSIRYNLKLAILLKKKPSFEVPKEYPLIVICSFMIYSLNFLFPDWFIQDGYMMYIMLIIFGLSWILFIVRKKALKNLKKLSQQI